MNMTATQPVRRQQLTQQVQAMLDFAGRELWEYGKPPASIERRIWFLLLEASRTERAMPGMPNQAAKAAHLPYEHTEAEIEEVEAEMVKDGVRYSACPIAVATPDEFARYDIVMGWYQFIRGHHPVVVRRMIGAMASGMTPKSIVRSGVFNQRTTKAVNRAKERAVHQIVVGLRETLGIRTAA